MCENKINYPYSVFEAVEKFIIGQKVTGPVSFPVYGDYNLPEEQRYYGNGLQFKNGYKYISHGGGCSGEDCNTTFILDSENKVIAKEHW